MGERLTAEQLADHFDRLGDHPSAAALRGHIEALEAAFSAAAIEWAFALAETRSRRYAKTLDEEIRLLKAQKSKLEQECAAYRAQLEGRLR